MAEKARRRAPPKQIDHGVLTELVGYGLRRAQAAVFSHFLGSVGKLGVSPGQFGVLVLIKENRGLTQSALAKALGIERSTMVAVIDRLESQGLVARVTSESDRRSYALALTSSGAALLDRVTPQVRAHERHIAARLSAREKVLLIDLLERVAGTAGRV
ncbi:MAG: MarR family transcriptional regulator [Alphaproteobacteria bacterium]|nr:MAG: MarR family transcriptional regulator [Alphaproteobacteria bacterium]